MATRYLGKIESQVQFLLGTSCFANPRKVGYVYALLRNVQIADEKLTKASLEEIEKRKKEMIERSIVQWYFTVGSQEICLERDSRDSTKFRVALMAVPLWRNEANVRSIKGNRKKERVVHGEENSPFVL